MIRLLKQFAVRLPPLRRLYDRREELRHQNRSLNRMLESAQDAIASAEKNTELARSESESLDLRLQTTTKQLRSQKSKYINAQKSVRSLSNDLDMARGQIAELAKQNGALQAQKAKLVGERDTARNQLAKLKDKHGTLQKEKTKLVRELKATQMRAEFLNNKLAAENGNFRIFRDSLKANSDPNKMEEECNRMRDWIELAGPKYSMSKFWETYFKINMLQLKEKGLENFKISVNQNYHNYLIKSIFDDKIRRLFKWYKNSEKSDLHILFSSIDNPDFLDPSPFLAHKDNQLFGDDKAALSRYRTYITLLWEYTRANDKLGLARQLSEPEVGNPIRVYHRGKLVSQDLATSILEANEFVPPLVMRTGGQPLDILEVGAGYGRLIQVLKMAANVRRYVIVDIPPAIFVSQWYVSQMYPQARVFGVQNFADWADVTDELMRADFVFLLPHQLPLVPNGFVDFAFTISSLHEMLPKQANWYLSEMGRISKHSFYTKQYKKYVNPHDGIVFHEKQYEYPESFAEAPIEQTSINKLFFSKLFQRPPHTAAAR